MINQPANTLPWVLSLFVFGILLFFLFAWNLRLRQGIRRNQTARQQDEGLFEKIVEGADDAMILYDPETEKIIRFNHGVCDIFGYQLQEVYFLNMELLFSNDPPYSLEDARPKIKAALDGSPQIFEWLTTDHTGKKLWVEISAKKIILFAGSRLLFFVRKISDRKKTEERLLRFISIVDQIGEGVATADLNGIITYVNQAWSDMHGYSSQTLIGKHLSVFHSDEQNLNEVTPINKKVLRLGYHRGEVGHKRSNGSLFTTYMTSTLQKDENGRVVGYIGVATDLSEQKKVEDALRENEIKFRYLFNLSPQPISMTDLNGKILDVNEKFCEKMRYSRKDVIGKSLLDLGFPAEDRQRFIDQLTQNGDVAGYEISLQLLNKEVMQVQLYAKLIEIKNSFYALTVFHDITPQHRLEAQLVQSQKMEAIGTLAGGIAHDFNNILSAILGYIELARIYIEPDNKVFQYLEEVFKAGNRAKDLVRQILSISRQTEQKRKPVNITVIIREALHMLSATLPSSIQIKENLDESVGLIEADPTQIHQVMMNLVTNAGQSMKEKGGILTVTLGSEEFPPTLRKKDTELAPGKYIKLTISDTGYGISEVDKERIFDPYYTTKAQGMGTGLGLSVAQSIVKKHGGSIHCSSKPGVGTDFIIYLPVMDKKNVRESTNVPEIKSLLPVGTEHILLVDDEETIIDTGRGMLEYLGYSVEIFNSSLSALREFEKYPERYDLIISDMTMPEMNGDEMAKKMILIRPDIPIIICTGYNPQIDETAAKAMGLKAFIFKPLTFHKLATNVRGVLDSTRQTV